MDSQPKDGRGSKPGERRGGRQKGTPNKNTADIRSVAQFHGKAAIERLAHLMVKAESEQAQVAACREILDRAYGKAPQALTVDPGETMTDMLKSFLGSIDGKSRGLPAGRAVPNGSGVAPRQPVPHPGHGGPNH